MAREILVGRKRNFYRQMHRKFEKVVLVHVAAYDALKFFSVQSLGVKLCLFDIRFSYKHCLSHAVAYSSTWRWLPKRWQGLFDLSFEARFKKISKRKKALVKPPYEDVQAQSLEAANRPCHGFRRHLDEKANAWEITLFVWESNVE